MANNKSSLVLHFHALDDIKRHWIWFFILGVSLLILGILAISASALTTVVSMLFLGILLLVGGAAQIVYSFWARKWSGFFLSLLIGLLYFITGILCVTRPVAAAVSFTLLMGSFCLVAGIFRVIAAASLRFDQWGWVLLNGIVTFLLGILILVEWPISGLWVIGLFIGIEMLFSGISWMFLSLSARKLKK